MNSQATKVKAALTTIGAARRYLQRHPTHKLFPIRSGAKTPPLFSGYAAKASNDLEVIRGWHKRWPGCTWGIAPEQSGIVVMDADLKTGKEGAATLADLAAKYGPLPKTSTVTTPSGGKHFRFKATAKVHHKFRVDGFGKHVDSPHYTIIPGIEINGGIYREDNEPLVDAPDWFAKLPFFANSKADRAEPVSRDFVVEPDTDAIRERAIQYLKEDAPDAIEGSGGEKTTLLVAMTLRDMGCSQSLALELMIDHYNVSGKCAPIWEIDGDNGLAKKVANAFEYAVNEPGARSPEADFDDEITAAHRAQSEANKRMTPEQRAEIVRKIKALLDHTVERGANPNEEKTYRENARRMMEKYEIKPEDMRGEGQTRGETWQSLKSEWVYVGQQERFVRKFDAMLWSVPAFDKHFANVRTPSNRTGSLSSYIFKQAEGVFTKYHSFTYEPGKPERVGNNYNQYMPSDVVPVRGDTKIWDEHLEFLFPAPTDRAHVLNWLAWVYQNLGKKPKHALFIHGEQQGTGKSWVADVFARIIGERNVTPVTQETFNDNFNGWALHTKLVTAEEVRDLKPGTRTTLHGWITQERLQVNEKNMPKVVMPDVIAYIFFSNRSDALKELDDSDRRYLVVRTDAKRRDDAYYRQLFKVLENSNALAAIAWQLSRRVLNGYTAQGRAPETVAKVDMIEAGASDVQQEMTDNAGLVPFCYSVVTLAEIIEALPRRLQREGVRSRVMDVLRRRFNGIAIKDQIQPRGRKGDKLRVWVIGDKAKALAKLSGAELGKVYCAEHDGEKAKVAGSFET